MAKKKRKTELDLDAIEEVDKPEPPKVVKKAPSPPKPPLSQQTKKRIIIIAAGLLLLSAFVSIGLYLYLKEPVPEPEVEKEEQEVIDTLKPPLIETIPLKSLASFLLPIKNRRGRERFLKIGISMQLSGEELEKEIEKNLSLLRDKIFQTISNNILDDLRFEKGRKAMRTGLKNVINMSLQTGSIKKVYFTELVIL